MGVNALQLSSLMLQQHACRALKPHHRPQTVLQVLRWMANPVPASQYSLACPVPTDMLFPGGRFCLPPTGGCVQVCLCCAVLSVCSSCGASWCSWCLNALPCLLRSCLQGNWLAATCACACINQGSKLPGFCPDPATGACTLVKQYHLTAGAFYCPDTVDSSAPTASSSLETSPSPTLAASPSPSPSPQPTTPSSPSIVKDASLNSTGQQPPPATQSPTTTTPTADVQPLGGVSFSFDVQVGGWDGCE